MVALPADLTYGVVTGTFIEAIADGADVGSDPDGIASSGTITFSSTIPYILDTTAAPPVTVTIRNVVCTIDATTGELLDERGAAGVTLIVNDPAVWHWKATVAIDGSSPWSVVFDVVGAGVDLTTVAPIATTSPPTTKGDKGDAGLLVLGPSDAVPGGTAAGTVILRTT